MAVGGGAVTTGVNAARYEWIATLDGDGQNDPADIPALLAEMFTIPSLYGYLVGFVLGTGFSLLCALLPPRLMEARVARLSE